jgi:hypothetical protein
MNDQCRRKTGNRQTNVRESRAIALKGRWLVLIILVLLAAAAVYPFETNCGA